MSLVNTDRCLTLITEILLETCTSDVWSSVIFTQCVPFFGWKYLRNEWNIKCKYGCIGRWENKASSVQFQSCRYQWEIGNTCSWDRRVINVNWLEYQSISVFPIWGTPTKKKYIYIYNKINFCKWSCWHLALDGWKLATKWPSLSKKVIVVVYSLQAKNILPIAIWVKRDTLLCGHVLNTAC